MRDDYIVVYRTAELEDHSKYFEGSRAHSEARKFAASLLADRTMVEVRVAPANSAVWRTTFLPDLQAQA